MTTKSPTSNTAPATGYVSANTLAVMLETTPTTIWRWSKNGRLPKPYRLGEGTTRWKIEEVNEALAKLAAEAEAAMTTKRKAARPGRGNAASQYDCLNSKSCFCRGQGSCITCAAWLRLYRHLQAMRQAVTA